MYAFNITSKNLLLILRHWQVPFRNFFAFFRCICLNLHRKSLTSLILKDLKQAKTEKTLHIKQSYKFYWDRRIAFPLGHHLNEVAMWCAHSAMLRSVHRTEPVYRLVMILRMLHFILIYRKNTTLTFCVSKTGKQSGILWESKEKVFEKFNQKLATNDLTIKST